MDASIDCLTSADATYRPDRPWPRREAAWDGRRAARWVAGV